jgi:uncharacterized protein
MLIGIISDTHDHADSILKAVGLFNKRNVDLVIHCGDWVSPFMPDFCESLKVEIISVFGNNEGDLWRFLERKGQRKWNIQFNRISVECELDGRNIIAYHGDSKPLLAGLIDSQKYDVVFSGHTHAALVERCGKTLHVNPGSPCGIAESKAGAPKTIAFYDTQKDRAEIVALD